jgi:hypothetical protein
MSDGRHRPRTQAILVAGMMAVGALTVLGAALYPRGLGVRQPIPFSHQLHAGTKQIGCLLCHPGAWQTPVAGLPSVQTCMLCHSRIIIHHPEIQKVRRHFVEGQPISWVRVTNLPDLAHFDHGMHLAAGVDCGTCHGNVKAMDRIVPRPEFTMGFCIECHRKNNATHDCFACHY